MTSTDSGALAADLSGEQVLAYIDGFFRPEAASTLRLRQTLTTLTAKSGQWQTLCAGNSLSCDASVQRSQPLSALLKQLQDQAGDLLLLRRPADRFMLLSRYRQPEWSLITDAGHTTPINEATDASDCAFADAVLLSVPVDDKSTLPRSALSYLRWLLSEAWAEVGVASLLINLGQLLLPLFSMLLYNKIINNGVFATLWALAIGMFIYLGTEAALRMIRTWTVERLATHLTHRDDMRLWRRLSGQQTGQNISIAPLLSHYRDLAIGREFISSSYLLALADIPFLIFYLLIITLIAWPLGLLTVVFAGLYLLISRELQEKITVASREAERAMTRKMGALGSMVAALDLLKTSARQHFLRRQWVELGNQANAAEQRRRLLQNSVTIVANLISPLTTVCLLILGAYLVEWQTSNMGALIACSMLAARCLMTISSLFTVLSKWEDFERATGRFEADTGTQDAAAATVCLPMPSCRGHLQVIDVSKTYPERPPILVNIALDIAPQEHLAILGKPGAGKTTLLRALAGLSAVDKGQVLIDSTRIGDIDIHDRSRWLVYKGQEPIVFAGTLLDNLQAETPERLQRALMISGLDEDIRQGRITLGTLLSEGGSNLSGGQRQKVALARALAQDARIFLLDEPSAGLDPDSERQFAQRLKAHLGEATVLMITHSPALIETVDRLIVLENGRIVIDGPRSQMFKAQAPA